MCHRAESETERTAKSSKSTHDGSLGDNRTRGGRVHGGKRPGEAGSKRSVHLLQNFAHLLDIHSLGATLHAHHPEKSWNDACSVPHV